MTKPSVDKKFIVQLQGKDFVTYEGLLDLAHQKGLQGIKTEIVQFPTTENNNQCIFKAIAYTEKGQFEGYGDADNSNVNSMIKRHLIRMAETRAKARALRDLTNVGMTAVEEMGGDESPQKPVKQKADYVKIMFDKVKEKQFSNESLLKYIQNAYKKNKSSDLTIAEVKEVIAMLDELNK